MRIVSSPFEAIPAGRVFAIHGGPLTGQRVVFTDTPVDEGQQILTRLQRSLTGGLFMHENKQVFVTFSAGVTAFRLGERIEEALERADIALYQAKRAGKNRTLIG